MSYSVESITDGVGGLAALVGLGELGQIGSRMSFIGGASIEVVLDDQVQISLNV